MLNGCGVSFGSDEDALELDGGGGAQHNKGSLCH